MRKYTTCLLISSVVVCTTVFLISACTLFKDSSNKNSILTRHDTKKFIKSIRAPQGNGESYYKLGSYFQERNKHKLAISEFYKALEYDPTYIKAYNAIGVSYDAIGEYDLATDSYNSALEIDPNNDHILNNLGYSYLLQSKPELATESFKKAIALNNDNEIYHNNLGLAYAKRGQFEDAYEEFRKNGDEAKAHYNIAKLYYEKGYYKEAKKHFAVANNSEPKAERAYRAANSLEKILAKKSDALKRLDEKTVDTPSDQIIQNDDKKVYSIPSANLEKSFAKLERERETKDENIESISTVEAGVYDNGGIYTIPKDALKTTESSDSQKIVIYTTDRDIAEKNGEEILVNVSMLQAMIQAENQQETPKGIMEEKGLVIFSESFAPQMMKIKKSDLTNRPVKRIKIEVKNGNGMNRMARRVGEYLRKEDIILMYLSNADNFKHKWSKIYYVSEYLQEAYQLSQKLPGLQTLVEVKSIRGGNAEISILLGKDLLPYDTMFPKG